MIAAENIRDWRNHDVVDPEGHKIGPPLAMAAFLPLILIAVALGIVGEVVKGLFYLLVIGIVIFLCAFIVLGLRIRRRHRRPVR